MLLFVKYLWYSHIDTYCCVMIVKELLSYECEGVATTVAIKQFWRWPGLMHWINILESVFPRWDLWYCQVNTGQRKSKEFFVGFGWCLWLRMCSLGETCGIVKLIPESASRKRFSLVLDDVYLWDWIINNNNELCTCRDILYLFVIHTTRWR